MNISHDAPGSTQQALLNALLHHKAGLTIDALAAALGISRSAVRQHLTALERDGMVRRGGMQPSGGRPEQLYILTPQGQERFPRQYSWFSELLIEALAAELGRNGLRERLDALGRQVGGAIHARLQGLAEERDQVAAIAALMTDMGYDAAVAEALDSLVIEAQNCVFHKLAEKYPEVCQLDLGLLAAASGRKVAHESCMVRGGTSCRFRFGRTTDDSGLTGGSSCSGTCPSSQ